MTNIKIFGYVDVNGAKAETLRRQIANIFSGEKEGVGMELTTISSRSTDLSGSHHPYIEVADSNPKRGRDIVEKLRSRLKEKYNIVYDMESTKITLFVPAD